MRFAVFIATALLFGAVTGQTCSSASPCAEGCCNKFGWCGYGPDYCSTADGTCVGNCDRKSECNPGYGSQWSQKDKCPLNVCCSKSGFCGTTEDFCGNKTVKRPSCPSDNGVTRVIGYYEGWVSDRPCNQFLPEDIPSGIYTHINFAFATINPSTFEVTPVKNADIDTYQRLMNLKKKDTRLKIYVAIGGWTFNDPGPTRTTFSDLAASIPRQQTFIKSLISFMSTYGFDGVDIDWEYPEADDRAGRTVDYANFPTFMGRVKSALEGASADGLSITLPASYWYLQHFDLEKLSKQVSFFNVMSYDMHGTWDKESKWLGAYLNAHTNLTEIESLGLDLLWRMNIPPGMVNLGIAFYGRSFTATSSSCMDAGCPWVTGGDPGPCSGTIGVLLNSEIDDIMNQTKIQPQGHSKAAVKTLEWGGNQWVSFDDADTFEMKSKRASELCLGGLFVWAISHDTKDAKYSKALAAAANRKVGTALPDTEDDGDPTSIVKVQIDQCHWTNCGEGCPSGWGLVRRSDPGARGEEYMFDETGCDGTRSHMYCCPPSERFPTCGWYTHNNGACDNTCPSGTIEIGSNEMYCRKNYQAACCTTDTPSMNIWAAGEWGEWPHCDNSKTCPIYDSKKYLGVTASSTGTGGSTCLTDSNHYYTSRRYCYDPESTDVWWKNCALYWEFGFAGKDKTPDNYCWPNCPNGLTRVALDGHTRVCQGKEGALAICCEAQVWKETVVTNPILQTYRDALNAYLDIGTCPPAIESISRLTRKDDDFSMAFNDTDTTAVELASKRHHLLGRDAQSDYHNELLSEALLLRLLTLADNEAMLKALGVIWDTIMGAIYENLKIASLRLFLAGRALVVWMTEGPISIVHRILCSPHLWNNMAGTRTITCEDLACTYNDDIPCSDPDNPSSAVRGSGGSKKKRTRRTLGISAGPSRSINPHLAARDETVSASRLPSVLELKDGAVVDAKAMAGELRSLLEKRARDYSTDVIDDDGTTYAITVTLMDHPSAGTLDEDDPMYDEAVDFADPMDCADASVAPFVIPTGRFFELEHPLDGRLIANFIHDANRGLLPSGATMTAGRVSASFFVQARTMTLPIASSGPLGPLPGGQNYVRPYQRIMECVGSNTNRANFVLAGADINQFKGILVQGKNLVDDTKWASYVQDTSNGGSRALAYLRGGIAVIFYMNREDNPPVRQRLANVVTDINDQWQAIQDYYNTNVAPGAMVDVAACWREWARAQMEWSVDWTHTWVQTGINDMRRVWGVRTGEEAQGVLEALDALEDELPYMEINTDAFPT